MKVTTNAARVDRHASAVRWRAPGRGV